MLRSRPAARAGATSQASAPRWFRVSVTDAVTGRNKVNMSIPMALVDVAIKMGARFVPETADVNLDELRDALRTGQQGKILTVEDREDGELVEIFVE